MVGIAMQQCQRTDAAFTGFQDRCANAIIIIIIFARGTRFPRAKKLMQLAKLNVCHGWSKT